MSNIGDNTVFASINQASTGALTLPGGKKLKLASKLIASALAAALLGPGFHLSARAADIPSLCLAGETSLLDARMGKRVGEEFKPNGRILSICTDKPKEPFNKIVYRYGTQEKLELEQIGDSSRKFFANYFFEKPIGFSTIAFMRGKVGYYVTELTNMGQGIRLVVMDGRKKVADLESPDNDHYQSMLFNIEFEKLKSPVFQKKDMSEVILMH